MTIRLLAVFTCAWLALSSALAEPAASLVLATYNVRNYLEQNRWHEDRFRMAYPKPEAEKKQVRSLIREADADILFLQELGSTQHLEELRSDLQLEGLHYAHSHFAKAEGARSGLAILAKVPIVQTILLDPRDANEDRLIKRGLQESTFQFSGKQLRVFHVHLKSRYTVDAQDPEAAGFRAREIKATEAFVAQSVKQYADDYVLLLGDFNTPFDDPLLEPLQRAWQPIQAVDKSGKEWTYKYQKTQQVDRIDGFWILQKRDVQLTVVEANVIPENLQSGSDHRLVAVRFEGREDN
jgi:endonuclease/exonuclease/phosphatase family metal-dependent hydrolase